MTKPNELSPELTAYIQGVRDMGQAKNADMLQDIVDAVYDISWYLMVLEPAYDSAKTTVAEFMRHFIDTHHGNIDAAELGVGDLPENVQAPLADMVARNKIVMAHGTKSDGAA